MSDAHITMALGLVAGALLVEALHFIAEIRDAQVVETIDPRTYQAVADVTAERTRQVTAEGFTSLKDDQYQRSELVWAAVSYAGFAALPHPPSEPAEWPWAARWWKPENPRRALVKAGALILAEIERLDRRETRKDGGR